MKASVDEGMSSREPSSYAAGAPVQLSEFEIAVDLESPLTNSRNVSGWVEHHDSHLILGEELAQRPAVGVAVLIELHPLHGFVVKRKRPGVGAWVTC